MNTTTTIERADSRADAFAVATRDPFKTIILLPAPQLDAPALQPHNAPLIARWHKGTHGLTMRWVAYSADER
ncbi:MAG: hypothetical protein H7Y32_02915 [Chloroflexales bacterium]|nr:hypothetical protein [Chloroflexales bacterium]